MQGEPCLITLSEQTILCSSPGSSQSWGLWGSSYLGRTAERQTSSQGQLSSSGCQTMTAYLAALPRKSLSVAREGPHAIDI